MAKPITPLLAVDIIICLNDRDPNPIVLIERKNPPLGWALPGGFVDLGETVEQAAVREALEETTLQVSLQHLLGVYSDPARDPRGHTVSVVYAATAQGQPKAADDAVAVALVAPDAPGLPLAFDHHRILQDYCAYLKSGVSPTQPR